MSAISRSGYYQKDDGRSYLVTQGIVGSTLVAGKQLLFRAFLNPSALWQIGYLVITVERPSGAIAIVVPQDHMIFEYDFPNGPSVGAIVRGFTFPKAGTYPVSIQPYSMLGVPIGLPLDVDMNFLPTKDLRLLVTFMFHQGVFEPTIDWYTDVSLSMERLGSMFPVRDCVQPKLNAQTGSGLRYVIGTKCDGWIAQGAYYACVYNQTEAINAKAGDDIDLTLEFRWGLYAPQWNPAGDPGPGGNSGRPPAPFSHLRRGGCVAGPWQGTEMTAPCFAQEIGHNFGLEPAGSPHFQDESDPGHSKDPRILDPFAFDFVARRPFNPPPLNRFLGDVMNNLAGGAGQGRDSIMFNAFDWEHLRQQFMLLNSTGTEINPTKSLVCGPQIGRKAVPPATWSKVLKGQAGGPLIRFGPNGIIVGPPPRPEIKAAKIVSEGLIDVMNELKKKKIGNVYLPYADEPLVIIGRPHFGRMMRDDLAGFSQGHKH